MTIDTFPRWTAFALMKFVVSSAEAWQAPMRKVVIDTNKNGRIEEEECMCDLKSDLLDPPRVTKDIIDYSNLKKYEAIAYSLAAMASALNGDIDPQLEISLLSDMLYQEPRGILGSWLGYTPDSYGTTFNKSYDMTKSVKLVSYKDCAYVGGCNYTDEHRQENITVRFFEQLDKNATLHFAYVYAKACCNPVSYGDYLGNYEGAWMWNYFSPDPTFDFFNLPLRDYLHGNKTWLEAGKWSEPYVGPMVGVKVSFGVPFVTRIPVPGSVDPYIFRDIGHAHPGFMNSFENLYIMGVAGIDVRLKDIVLECADGFYSTYPTCSACPLGTYRTVADSGGACLECTPGSYTDKTGSSACILCRAGYFQNDSGKNSCDRCSPGTAQTHQGTSACLQCAIGSAMGDWNASDCSLCPVGQYSIEQGTVDCLQCPYNMVTGVWGSVSVQDCICVEGTFLSLISLRCEPCPRGMTCHMGSEDPSLGDLARAPHLLVGYYSSIDEPLSVYYCADASSCPGGVPGTCGAGRVALACQFCEAGRYASTEGDCKQCNNADIVSFVVVFVVGLIGASLSHVAVNFPLLKNMRNGGAGVFFVGLLVTAMLSFSIYANLDRTWLSPMSYLFSILRLVAFDLRLVKFDCFAGSSKLMPRCAFKLAAIPCAFLALSLTSFVMKFTGWTRRFAFISIPDLINSGGILFSTFFIALSLVSFEGFMCTGNPNGINSLITDRSVVCWNSKDHADLVVLSSVAILIYPVSFIVVSIYCTRQYHALAERFGTGFFASTRFLMNCWKPDLHYFATLHTIRNLALTITPILQPNSYDVQVMLLHSIFLFWLFLVLSLKPWRFDILNKLDAVLGSMQIVVLTCFSLLGGRVGNDSLSDQSAGSIAYGAFVIVISLTLCSALWSWAQSLRRLKEYGLFLSHHKGVDAVYSRQIKLMLATVTSRQVFLDVDNLASLDELVFIVCSRVENLVVMLSPELFYRFWCAVEIICATKHQVNIILANTHPVENLFSAEFFAQVPNMWTQEQIMSFTKIGIEASSDTELAYKFLSTMRIIRMLMESSEFAQTAAISKLLAVANGCPEEKLARKVDNHHVSYVVYNTNCFIQASCARILCMLMKTNRWLCMILRDDTGADTKKAVMLVLVSHGFAKDPIGLGHMCHAHQNFVPFTTVVSQDDFQRAKPSNRYLEKLQDGSAFDEEQLTTIRRIEPNASTQAIADVVVAVYGVLAAGFHPQQSEDILLVEMNLIVNRSHQLVSKLRGFQTTRSSWSVWSNGSRSKPLSPKNETLPRNPSAYWAKGDV